ncbi:MAG: ribbon-helix-helix domain-containing protein [Hyphomicrobiaceae bacterium]|nr:ribbon-helix-helix domain-containing protein [Hyphomicrobiaceae bacterium]
MSSPIQKYSLTIKRHRTSISLEEPFYEALVEVAREKGKSLAELIGEIDQQKRQGGLSSAIRIYLLNHYRQKMRSPEG